MKAFIQHEDLAPVVRLSRNTVLQGVGVEFGGINALDPHAASVSWSVGAEAKACQLLKELGFSVICKHQQIIRATDPPPVMIQKRRPLELETVLEAGGGLLPKSYAPVQLQYTWPEGWWGKVPTGVHMLTGLRINGKGINRVSVYHGCCEWAGDYVPSDAFTDIVIQEPGGVVWPLIIGVHTTSLVVCAPGDAAPTLRIEHARLPEQTLARLTENEIYSFAFNSHKGAIARWSLPNDMMMMGGLTPNETQPYIDRMRKKHLEINAAIDEEPTKWTDGRETQHLLC